MTSFTLFNTLQQGLRVSFMLGWEIHGFMLGGNETTTFNADELHPDTEALIDKGYLRHSLPLADRVVPVSKQLSPLAWGGDWKPGLYPRGTMVSHNGVLWVNNVEGSNDVPSSGTSWTPSAGAGDAAAHISNLNNPHATDANQVGAIPTRARGVPGGVAALDQSGKVPLAAMPDLLAVAALLETYQLRHQRNTDKGLDLGGANEVLASEILSHLTDQTTNPHRVSLLQLGGVAASLLGTAGGVATLDGSGRLSASQFPSLRITDVFLVDNNTQRDALAATLGVGDAVVVKSPLATYLWNGTVFSPVTAGVNVVSVNGLTGTLIELSTSNIPEGSHFYFTNERVAASPVVTALQAQSHDRNKDQFLDFGGASQVAAATLKAHLASQQNPHQVTASQAGALPVLLGTRELNGDYVVSADDRSFCLRFVAGATVTFAADLPVGFQVTIMTVNGATVTLVDASLFSRGTVLNKVMAGAFVYKPYTDRLEAFGDFVTT